VDDKFDVKVSAIKLIRTYEMLRYYKEGEKWVRGWVEHNKSSNDNSKNIPWDSQYENNTIQATTVIVGNFSIPLGLISDIHGSLAEYNPIIQELHFNKDKFNTWVIDKNENKYYKKVLTPGRRVGEYRVTFKILKNKLPITLIGVQSQSTITQYTSPFGNKQYWLFNGIHSADSCLEQISMNADINLYWHAICVVGASYCSTEVFWSVFVPFSASFSAACMKKPLLLCIPVIVSAVIWGTLQKSMDTKMKQELNKLNENK